MIVKTCRGIVAVTVGTLIGWGAGAVVSGATDAAYGAGCKPHKHHKRQSQACRVPTIANPPANPTRADLVGMGIPVERWFSLGRCEQPGAGVGGVDWTNEGRGGHTGFLGGLGFAASTYGYYKPKGYPWPPRATPWQIIIVGERVKAAVGITAWGAHDCF